MSDAWDGLLWEQEQPVAVLLSENLVEQLTAEDARERFPSPSFEEDEPEAGAKPHTDTQPADGVTADERAPGPMQVDEYEPQSPTTPRTTPVVRLRRKRKTTERQKKSATKVVGKRERELYDEEQAARVRLTREQTVFWDALRYHRQDDREFWQLLERQRVRRERRCRQAESREHERVLSARCYYDFRGPEMVQGPLQ